MKIGFTGTREGMSERQRIDFTRLIQGLLPSEFYHGDCIGADAEAHNIVKNVTRSNIHIHPPNDGSKRACLIGDFNYPPKPYLERNKDIVKACDLLIACPKGRYEENRSGTWSTVRYARKINKPMIILLR